MQLGDPWGSEASPSGVAGAYANTLDAIVPGTAAQAAATQQPNEDPISALFRVAEQYANTQAQLDLIRQNRNRAMAGQLPMYFAPQQSTGMTEETKKMLLIGGLAIGGLLVLPKLLKR